MALRDELLGVLILVFAGLMAGCGGGDSQECQSDADCADGLVCRDHECVEPDDPCAGVVCDSPPDDFCSDPDTLTTYTSNGTCDEGQCTYSSSEVPCNDGCLEQPGDDVCEGDPCAGVICDQIPADYCFDPDMLHTYTGTGHCQSGACIYDYDDVHCPNGCADGACIGCVPSCAGKCGGPDGCGDRCPDTCTGGRVCRGPEYTFCASRGAVEVLGRGLVALPKDGGIYLGWRLLPWDDPQVGFNLYRAESAAGPFTTLVNSSPVTGSTNFHDTGVQASSTWWYVVRTVATGGAEGPDSNLARATAGSTRNRIDIAMAPTPDCPSGLNWDASSWGGVTPGDVNGDGMLDFVLLMLDRDNHSHPYCIELFLSRDGGWVSSWRVPTGYPANRDSSVVVRDFDGDGRAEIFTRAEAGGNLCRLDAETGAVAESVPWPYSQGGLGYGMLVHAWLEDADQDGFPEPFVLTQNGMYLDPPQNPRFTAWRWDPDSGFTKRRDVTFSAAGFDEDHPYTHAMGTHGFIAADLTGDGLDEVMPCGSVLYPDWSGYWVLADDHSDICHPADVVPGNPGPELLVGSDKGEGLLAGFDTGVPLELWTVQADYASGWDKGWCSELTTDHPGMECGMMDHDETQVECEADEDCPHPELQHCDMNVFPHVCTVIMVSRLFDSGGQEITGQVGLTLQYQGPLDWSGGDGVREIYQNNCSPANPTGCMSGQVADVVGDSREEVMSADFTTDTLRIFVNPQLIDTRRVTPLADRGYRAGMGRLGSAGYNKIANVSNQPRLDLVPAPVDPAGICEGKPEGHTCRPVRGDCDLAEVCDGVSSDCPADRFEPVGTVCRPASEACDPHEVCPGDGPDCPPDVNDCLSLLLLYLYNGTLDPQHELDLDPGEDWECYEYNAPDVPCTRGERSCNCCERDGNQYRAYFVPWETYVPTAIGPWVSNGVSEAEVGDGCATGTFPCYYTACGQR